MKNLLYALVIFAIILSVFYVIKINQPVQTQTQTQIPTPVPVIIGDSVLVDQYIRANITTLAPDTPVLGGSWYVTSVVVDTVAHTGTVSYEDGHIASTATFTYIRNGDLVSISNIIKTSK